MTKRNWFWCVLLCCLSLVSCKEDEQCRQERYVRIAFESLDEFLKKKNRETHFLVKESSAALMPIYLAIRNNDFATADIELKKLIEEVSLRIYQIETCVRP